MCSGQLSLLPPVRQEISSLRATGWRLVWLIGAVVCLLAANRGSSCSLTRAITGHIHVVRCGIISSCQSAATSEIVKALLAMSSSHVRSAIANTEPYLYFTFRPTFRLPTTTRLWLLKCPPQRHLVDSRSEEGSSGCRNVNKFSIKGCFLINLCNL